MALPNYTSRNDIRQQHGNWNNQRVNRVWNRQQTGTTPGAAGAGGAAAQPHAAAAPPVSSQPAPQQAVYDPVPQNQGYQGNVVNPQQSLRHPFFDPNSNYAQTGWQHTVMPGMGNPGNNTFNFWAGENPEGYYYSVLNERGLGGTDARSQVAQGMFRDTMRGYEAAKTRNMSLQLPQYMQTLDLDSILDMLSEEQLGIDRSRFSGRDRWGMRGGQ